VKLITIFLFIIILYVVNIAKYNKNYHIKEKKNIFGKVWRNIAVYVRS